VETTDARQAKLVICDQAIDITYLRLCSRFMFLAVILDAFTRAVRGWHLGRSLSHELAVRALEQCAKYVIL
jgi:transposase InsO family protein